MFSSRKPFGLLKDFQIAEQMIERLKTRRSLFKYLSRRKEVIVTGEIGGAMWKGKIDCLNLEEKYFVDIKTTKDMHEKKWDERLNRKANFIERFGYVLQMAVYCELLRQQYDKNFSSSHCSCFETNT